MRRLFGLLLSFIVLPAIAAQRSAIVAFPATAAEVVMLDAAAGDPEHLATNALKAVSDKPLRTRWVGSTKGDRVRAYLFYRDNGDSVGVDFKEEPRQTVFEKQFQTLVKLAGGAGGAEAPLKMLVADHVLQQTRANLTVTAKSSDSAQGLPDSPAPDPNATVSWVVVIDLSTEDGSANVGEVAQTFVTGPREPLSITAAVPLDKVSQLKFNKETQQTELKENPTSYYAGFDYTMGDAIGDPQTLAEAISFKVLTRASRKPFDSYGIGIGLRPGAFALLMPNTRVVQVLNTFTPFIAYIRSKEDKAGEGAAGVGKGTTQDIRWGVSLDLSKALDWVKKDSKPK